MFHVKRIANVIYSTTNNNSSLYETALIESNSYYSMITV